MQQEPNYSSYYEDYLREELENADKALTRAQTLIEEFDLDKVLKKDEAATARIRADLNLISEDAFADRPDGFDELLAARELVESDFPAGVLFERINNAQGHLVAISRLLEDGFYSDEYLRAGDEADHRMNMIVADSFYEGAAL